jgi:hypothetical protein
MLMLQAAQTAAQDSEPARGEPRGRTRTTMADPSAVIAADFALARNARNKGEAEALRASAGQAALVLAPRAVPAAPWLKRSSARADPPHWQPRTVWTSCDGGHAITRGTWRRGAAEGEYFALWQRQPKGGWRWLLHEDGPAASLGEAPEMISGKVAECASLPPRPRGFVPPPVTPLDDASRDGSLEWAVQLGPQCALSLTVRAWDGAAMREVLSWARPAPASGCG